MEKNNRIIELSAAETVDMADEWYEFASLDHFWIRWRFEAITRFKEIQRLPGKRLLEIGCGHGLIVQQFESMPGVVVDGCDLNLHALQHIPKTKGDVYLLDIFEKPPQLLNKYSAILLMDVIEHIDDDVSFVKNACDYLADSGLVIINVPALNILYSKYDERACHKRRYNKKMLRALLKKNNMEIIDIRYWGFFLVPLLLIRKILMKFTPERKIIKLGFAPFNKALNGFFKFIMKIEMALFRTPVWGTSVVAIGKKKK